MEVEPGRVQAVVGSAPEIDPDGADAKGPQEDRRFRRHRMGGFVHEEDAGSGAGRDRPDQGGGPGVAFAIEEGVSLRVDRARLICGVDLHDPVELLLEALRVRRGEAVFDPAGAVFVEVTRFDRKPEDIPGAHAIGDVVAVQAGEGELGGFEVPLCDEALGEVPRQAFASGKAVAGRAVPDEVERHRDAVVGGHDAFGSKLRREAPRHPADAERNGQPALPVHTEERTAAVDAIQGSAGPLPCASAMRMRVAGGDAPTPRGA